MKTYPDQGLKLNIDKIREAFEGWSQRINPIADEVKVADGHQKYALGEELEHTKKVGWEGYS